MGWPYRFIELTTRERHERRVLLDRYGLYAQLSAISIVLVLLTARLVKLGVQKVSQRRAYDEVPTTGQKASASPLRTRLRRVIWWLHTDVVVGVNLGRRDQFVYGSIWTAWLLFLCFSQTGHDYLHLAKRFGAIGVSQLPLQYLLSLKRLNPVAFALGTSHEQANRWHRTLGYISFLFILLHGIFYLNYYVQAGDLAHPFVHVVPALGLVGLCLMMLLNTTTLSMIRQYSYRVFYITHIFVACMIPPLIWMHVHHSRLFMAQCMVIFVADRIVRQLNVVTVAAFTEGVRDTNLLKINTIVPSRKLKQFLAQPASHVYVGIPSQSRPGYSLWSKFCFYFISNPFTVAAVHEDAEQITLVTRQMRGPMTNALTRLASLQAPNTELTLTMEGPYGRAGGFTDPTLSRFDKILLVAGGVGGTFIMPLYEYIASTSPSAQVQMIWAVRDIDETTWPMKEFLDERVRLFITGNADKRASIDTLDVELSHLNADKPSNGKTRRPNLQEIVDDTFQDGVERVAVVVCGPAQMSRDLRRALGFWVKQGKDVYFHNEMFS